MRICNRLSEPSTMVLSREQIEELIRTLSLTRTVEADCDECLGEMAEFAEMQLQGKTVSESLRAVEHHLAMCGECQEEYEALVTALKAAEGR